MTARTCSLLAALAYAAVLAVNRSLVEVRGPSMEPTLRAGDRLVALPVALVRPRPGDIVVLTDPGDPGHQVIKRLVDLDAATADVRGDAPTRSTDSRTWGRIPRANLRRVMVARWPWPTHRAGEGARHRRRRATTRISGSSSPTSPGPRRP